MDEALTKQGSDGPLPRWLQMRRPPTWAELERFPDWSPFLERAWSEPLADEAVNEIAGDFAAIALRWTEDLSRSDWQRVEAEHLLAFFAQGMWVEAAFSGFRKQTGISDPELQYGAFYLTLVRAGLVAYRDGELLDPLALAKNALIADHGSAWARQEIERRGKRHPLPYAGAVLLLCLQLQNRAARVKADLPLDAFDSGVEWAVSVIDKAVRRKAPFLRRPGAMFPTVEDVPGMIPQEVLRLGHAKDPLALLKESLTGTGMHAIALAVRDRLIDGARWWRRRDSVEVEFVENVGEPRRASDAEVVGGSCKAWKPETWTSSNQYCPESPLVAKELRKHPQAGKILDAIEALGDGATQLEIAEHLGVSDRTVRAWLQKIKKGSLKP